MSVRGREVALDDGAIERLRDTMAHRGPDGAGLWRGGHVALAHRRLAVIDRSPAAAQPMLTADGRCALVYNGELYNDDELRCELEAEGVIFRTASDTETVLRALERWGVAGLRRMRGMFALGFVDLRRGEVVLARDPLGIKPLYWTTMDGGRELMFASEVPALLGHPAVTPRPDLVTVSAYLTTIRTVLGERTLFAGIHTLRPGQILTIDTSGPDLRITRGEISLETGRAEAGSNRHVQIERVRRAVRDSLRRHLRADVPLCALLSGGLDSSILAQLAMEERGLLSTYCSGAFSGDRDEDFAFARLAAAQIQSRHVEAPVTRKLFAERWPEMVRALGAPLSTPNEVAINEVARRLRQDGMVVALSGEGADELFGGYEAPLCQAADYVAGRRSMQPQLHPGEFELFSNAWIPVEDKALLLQEGVLRAVEEDEALRCFYREEFERLQRAGEAGLQAHLRFHRRINLAGLLQRLDTATMLEGVEGRTPFADRTICEVAEALPLELKFVPASASAPARTKIALREAFSGELPPAILTRPKASFPLPFQAWAADQAGVLRESAFAREVFTAAAIEQVVAHPQELWNMAWPMINVALWGGRWWGAGWE